MLRPRESCWQKPSDARFEETSRELGDRRTRLLAATSVRADWNAPEDVPLCVRARGRLRAALKALTHERCLFGCRRLHILLRRTGIEVNHKRVFRLYREESLTVRRRGGRKRAIGTRAPMAIPQGANQRWSVDFVADVLSDGRRFRILTVVDDYARENLALVVDTSLSGVRVACELDRIVRSFNGRLRDECLNEHLFDGLADARRIIASWRADYNDEGPHTSLGGMTPTEFATIYQRSHRDQNQNRTNL